MTATDELRRMLDERGVEWAEYGDGYTLLRHGGREYTVQPNVCNRLIVTNLTPEQATAATLGSCNCTNDCTNGERTGTCLPHFWTHDGVLHVELPKLPESISVRLPAQHDREVGSARVWQYTRDSGTCRVDVLNTGDCAGYECSEYIMHCNGCGHEFGHVLYNEDGDVWMSEPPNYCPNCGAKVVGSTTNNVDAEVDA